MDGRILSKFQGLALKLTQFIRFALPNHGLSSISYVQMLAISDVIMSCCLLCIELAVYLGHCQNNGSLILKPKQTSCVGSLPLQCPTHFTPARIPTFLQGNTLSKHLTQAIHPYFSPIHLTDTFRHIPHEFHLTYMVFQGYSEIIK